MMTVWRKSSDQFEYTEKGVDKYDNVRLGLNARLDTLQAAILLEKLAIYEDELERRNQIADRYTTQLSNISEKAPDAKLKTQLIPEGSSSAFAQFVLVSEKRDQIAAELKEQEIPSLIYYRTPAHQLKACEKNPLSYDLPVSEKIAKHVLAIPFHPYLHDSNIQSICCVIEQSVLPR